MAPMVQVGVGFRDERNFCKKWFNHPMCYRA